MQQVAQSIEYRQYYNDRGRNDSYCNNGDHRYYIYEILLPLGKEVTPGNEKRKVQSVVLNDYVNIMVSMAEYSGS